MQRKRIPAKRNEPLPPQKAKSTNLHPSMIALAKLQQEAREISGKYTACLTTTVYGGEYLDPTKCDNNGFDPQQATSRMQEIINESHNLMQVAKANLGWRKAINQATLALNIAQQPIIPEVTKDSLKPIIPEVTKDSLTPIAACPYSAEKFAEALEYRGRIISLVENGAKFRVKGVRVNENNEIELDLRDVNDGFELVVSYYKYNISE